MDLYYCWQYILCFHCQSCLSASNGNPRLPDSLHYIDPSGRPNAYQRVRNKSHNFNSYNCLLSIDLFNHGHHFSGNIRGWRSVTVL